jgi:hypothetical protein
MDCKKRIWRKKNFKKRASVLVLCLNLIVTSILIFGSSIASPSADEMTLTLFPDSVDFSAVLPDKKLNPYDIPYLTVNNAVKAKVTSSCKYDFSVKAEDDLVMTEDGQPVSTISIANLYWQWKAEPGWHPFTLSPETEMIDSSEPNVDQGGKEYEFDYRIFSETIGLGWDIKPGEYKTTIKYSVFPSPSP